MGLVAVFFPRSRLHMIELWEALSECENSLSVPFAKKNELNTNPKGLFLRHLLKALHSEYVKVLPDVKYTPAEGSRESTELKFEINPAKDARTPETQFSFSFDAIHNKNGVATKTTHFDADFYSPGLLTLFSPSEKVDVDDLLFLAVKIYIAFFNLRKTEGSETIWPVLSRDWLEDRLNNPRDRWVRFGWAKQDPCSPVLEWGKESGRREEAAALMWKACCSFAARSYSSIRREQVSTPIVTKKAYEHALAVKERTRQAGTSARFFHEQIHELTVPQVRSPTSEAPRAAHGPLIEFANTENTSAIKDGLKAVEQVVKFHLSLLNVITNRWQFRLQYEASGLSLALSIAFIAFAYLQLYRIVFPAPSAPPTPEMVWPLLIVGVLLGLGVLYSRLRWMKYNSTSIIGTVAIISVISLLVIRFGSTPLPSGLLVEPSPVLYFILTLSILAVLFPEGRGIISKSLQRASKSVRYRQKTLESAWKQAKHQGFMRIVKTLKKRDTAVTNASDRKKSEHFVWLAETSA